MIGHERIMIVMIAAAIFTAALYSDSAAQRRKDDFMHSTAAHKKMSCAACHKVPTPNWTTARQFPDVADFPGHASCISCHRKDFFSGNRPAICASCHVTPGPRGVARFPFPVRSRTTEFKTIFPHDVHQNLIASVPREKPERETFYVRASYAPADDPVEFNNCALCHKTPAAMPRFVARTIKGMQPLVDAATESFTPMAAFFKDNPSSHASCFNCHYQNVKPSRTDCAGCHTLSAPYARSATASRYSIKFDHSYKDHVNKDCTICHVRITQNSDVQKMFDADVPFMTCSTSSCHGKHIEDETVKREETLTAKQPAFQCIYCHSTAIGRYPIPESHKAR
jgi:hypothetical protein